MTRRTRWTRFRRWLARWVTGNPHRDEYAPGLALTLDEYRLTHPSPPARGEAMTTHPRRER